MQKIKNIGKIILAKIYFSWLSKPALNKIKFEMYKKLVRPGEFIAFHDIVDNDFDKSFGTQIFWKEIKNNFEYQEFIRLNPQKTGCGIGLIKIPE